MAAKERTEKLPTYSGTVCGVSEQAEVVEKRISLCQQFLCEVDGLESKGVRGAHKLRKLLASEHAFLRSLIQGAGVTIDDEHLSSSNLPHVEGILHLCSASNDVVAVKQCFHWYEGHMKSPLLVDVVAHEGRMWVKVFARKRRSLHRTWLGVGEPGEKSVTEFAEEFLEAGKQNVAHFECPQIAFCFFDGLTASIQEELHKMNVLTIGPVFPDDFDQNVESPLLSMGGSPLHHKAEAVPTFVIPSVPTKECSTVNLDVSSMIAWVSELTHGGHVYTFSDPALREQARQEKECPVWTALQEATQDKELVVCGTALRDFVSIVDTVGGRKEQGRARELLSRVRAVKDCTSPRIDATELSARIKQRAKVIFGTGDNLQAVTLTANKGFVRAVKQQGLSIAVCIHSSRALAERAICHS